MRTSRWIAGWAMACVLIGAGAGPVAAASAQPAGPHIVAKPNNVMVNTATQLTGTGFAPNRTLTIEECSAKNWVVVVSHPCVASSAISVTTDSHGHFTHSFTITLCGGKRGPFPTSQVCYVGNPQPKGIDTMKLVGAARVIVTYP